MITKLFKLHKQPKPSNNNPSTLENEGSSALKIVHAGGAIESYYMAIPAVRILEKYPSYVLTKPEVFRRPWDSVVRPEKILLPGKKYFLVPVQTVEKLRRKIKKPSYKDDASVSFASNSNAVVQVSSRSKSGVKKHVRFTGVDVKQKGLGSIISEKKKKKKKKKKKNKGEIKEGGNRESGSASWKGKRRPWSVSEAWEPSLKSITESQGD
ncbi:hypothetical protein JCGZ_01730 [Jatropha curcas]|uniref:Uncharacterized protein n=1 Tax=Jatropha curcas TaxID=180498 RepID=A0A067JJJ7_JATCU|nr:hypothetical protein JCGZ_01730 [Jatropha curcas]